MENKPQSSYSWQTFSIFLSSTFADMHAERDYLKNLIFPRIEEELTKRRIQLNIVDLRWGVNTESKGKEENIENENELKKEEEREKNILKVCLAEIELCHPFFIGLLGDRYGWVPDPEGKRISDVSAGKTLMLPNKGKSVTALEIEFGVLVNPNQIKRFMFYFREPLDYSKFSPGKAAIYCEEFDHRLSTKEKEERKNSLDKLKKIITEHFKKIGYPENVKTYSAEWDQENQKIVGLKEWGDKVYKDVLQECENQAKDTWDLLPKNWQEQELALLDAFIESHTHVTTVTTPGGEVKVETFCGREKLLGELRQFLISSEKGNWGIVLIGESGSGKSAVFSMIFVRMKKENCFILAHSAGLSPRSRNIMDMLQIWNKQLGEFLGIGVMEEKFADEQESLRRPQLEAFSRTEEKKTGIEKAQDEFRELLFMASQRKPVVILIDALDRFEPTERASYMTWLPESLPENVKVLCTAVTGTEQKAVEFHKNLKVRSIDVFSKEDAREMILSMCTENHKTLNEAIIQTILQNEREDKFPAASSPLWLSLSVRLLLVLDQDDFEKINRKEEKNGESLLEDYMKEMTKSFPPLPGGLFLHLLLKASSVFGEDFTYLVFDYIACSRNGLRESDLEKLFKEKKGIEWDALLFANLRRWFKGHLQEHGYDAQWNLNHSILRNTVLEKMDKEKNSAIHQTIALHLHQLPSIDPLRISEIMYHLMKAGNVVEAVSYYNEDLDMVEAEASTKVLADAIIENKEGMQWAFAMIEAAKDKAVFGQSVLVIRFLHQLYYNLEIEGRLHLCLELLEKLKETMEEQTGSAFVLSHDSYAILKKLGSVYHKLGNLEKALSLFEESIQSERELYEFMLKGSYEFSGPNIDRKRSLANSCKHLGALYNSLGNTEKALNYFEESLQLNKVVYENDHENPAFKQSLANSYEKLGEIQTHLGDSEKALISYETSFSLLKEIDASTIEDVEEIKYDMVRICQHLGDTFYSMANLEKAKSFCEESLQLNIELHESNPRHPIFKSGLASSYQLSGNIYTKLGYLEKALENYEKSFRLDKELVESDPLNLVFKEGLLDSYEKLGSIYTTMGNLEKALRYYEDRISLAKELCETSPKAVQFKNILANTLNRLGNTHSKMGNLKNALDYYEKCLELDKAIYESNPENIYYKNHLAVCYENIGIIYANMSDPEKAIGFHEKSIQLKKGCSEINPKSVDFKYSLVQSYESIGYSYTLLGKWEQAIKFYEEGLRLAKELHDLHPQDLSFKNSLAIFYEKVGSAYIVTGNTEKAAFFYEKSLWLSDELYKSDTLNTGFKNRLATSYEKIGDLYKMLGNSEKSLISFEKSLQLTKELSESDPLNFNFKYELASIYERLGTIHTQLGNLEKSLAYCKECLQLAKELYELEPQDINVKNGLALSYERLGSTYGSLGDLQKTLVFYEESLKLNIELHESYPQNPEFKKSLASLYSRLGSISMTMGNLEKAFNFFESSNRLMKELYDIQTINTDYKNRLAVSYQNLGQTCISLGNLERAMTSFESFHCLMAELYEANLQNVNFKNGFATSYEKLGEIHISLNNPMKAMTFLENSYRLMKELCESDPANAEFKFALATSSEFLGYLSAIPGDLEKSRRLHEESMRLRKELYLSNSQNVEYKNVVAISCQFLGITHSALGNLEKALDYFKDFNRLEKELYESNPQNVPVKNALAVSCEKLGTIYAMLEQPEIALTFYKENLRLLKELYESSLLNVKFKNELAMSYLKLGIFYRWTRDNTKAVLNLQVAEKLFTELVENFPNLPQFRQQLEMARRM